DGARIVHGERPAEQASRPAPRTALAQHRPQPPAKPVQGFRPRPRFVSFGHRKAPTPSYRETRNGNRDGPPWSWGDLAVVLLVLIVAAHVKKAGPTHAHLCPRQRLAARRLGGGRTLVAVFGATVRSCRLRPATKRRFELYLCRPGPCPRRRRGDPSRSPADGLPPDPRAGRQSRQIRFPRGCQP